MKRMFSALLLLVLAVVCSFADGEGEQEPPEYRVKGVFLEKFADFVDWPDGSSVNNKSTPFCICVIGENPFLVEKKDKNSGDWLHLLYNNREIRGKKVKTRFISDVKDIPGCHLLFISRSEKKYLGEIVSTANKNHILTVSDTPGFSKKGVHINFYIEKDYQKFEVNETAIRESGFRVSYHMLKLAKIVFPWEERK